MSQMAIRTENRMAFKDWLEVLDRNGKKTNHQEKIKKGGVLIWNEKQKKGGAPRIILY